MSNATKEVEVTRAYRCSDGTVFDEDDYGAARRHQARINLFALVEEMDFTGTSAPANLQKLEQRADELLRALLPFASSEFHDEMRENY